MKCKHFRIGAVTTALIFSSSSLFAADTGSVVTTQQKTDTSAQVSQKKIDQYSDKTQQMFADYKATLRQLDSMRVYNNQVERMVTKQEAELASLHRQIEQIDQTSMEVVPLMLKMVDALDEFIALDLPFQTKERTQRIANLRELMDSPDVTTSEKFRKVMDAYQIEESFSRTIESYKASLKRDGKVVTYDFLRLGRVALLYQSPDGDETGMWNNKTHSWVSLPDSYRSSVQEGIRIAKKQAPPALIKLPVYTGETSL
ncbi:MAG: DUF3450 domain-containing protein [Vibrio sp.]